MYLDLDSPPCARRASLLQMAETAARAVPPTFPLAATVAVNPFVGQSDQDLAMASARLGRVAGVRLTPGRASLRSDIAAGRLPDSALTAALTASALPGKPASLADLKACLAEDVPAPRALPTVAQLAARHTGTDWPGLIGRAFGLWAAGHFDLGQALWTPAPGRGAFAAWRDWAVHDLSPEIAGLTGFCARVADTPQSAGSAILRACDTLGLDPDSAPTAFHRLLCDLGGWAHHARYLLWQAEQAGRTDSTLTDLLAIRLIWEAALLDHAPGVADDWAATAAAHRLPVAPDAAQVAEAIAQDARERAFQTGLAETLAGPRPLRPDTPQVQAAFCIDVRSEVFRRAFETVAPDVATIGFAGFFGLPLAHRAHGTDIVTPHLPVLLRPALTASSHSCPDKEQRHRIQARAARAWGRFRQAAVSSFAFVEAAGPLNAARLLRDALGQGARSASAPLPRLDPPLPASERAACAARVLTALGLTGDFAPLVLLLGHGAQIANNPHESAYHCGACGGQTGEVSARVLAQLLNDPDTRAHLGDHGIDVPAATLFVAGLHDTTTDSVTLFEDTLAPERAADLDQVRVWLARAGALARQERAPHLPGAQPDTLARRAADWSETRPEWGLAGCAAFIAAPRAVTAGLDLRGRAFLHSYDWRTDPGFATLELILTAPVVVASWISLQYYGSTVAPSAFGGGNKLIHNVTGGLGVVEGNGGMLHTGLPVQAVHDGQHDMHDPLRLSVLIAAPRAAIDDVLARHDGVRALFDNGWLHLFTLEDGRMAARRRAGGGWQGM